MERLIRQHISCNPNIGAASFSKEKDLSGNFRVGWDRYISFWKEYCIFLKDPEKRSDRFTLFEFNKSEASLCFQLYITFVTEILEFPLDLINLICTIIIETINEKLNLDDNENPLVCLLLGINKKKVTLVCNLPSVRIEQSFFNTEIVTLFCEKLRQNSVMLKFPSEVCETWDQMISLMDGFFQIFGSKDAHCDVPLEFIGVWSSSDATIGKDITEYFAPRDHSSIKSHCNQQSCEIDNDDSVYMPLILSSMYSSEITHPRLDHKENKSVFMSEISSSCEMDMIHHLLPLVSHERLNNSMYRWQIGRVIYNIFEGNPDGLHLMNSYTQKFSDENKKNWCEYREDAGINDFLSIRTVGFFAQCDNPDLYYDWHQAWIKEVVNRSLSKSQLDVAEVMYRHYWLEFLTIGKNKWFRFSPGSTRIVESVSNVEFIKKFGEMIAFYTKIQKEICDKLTTISIGENSESNKKKLSDQGKTIYAIIDKLGDRVYQKNIESHCFPKFYREGIQRFFDTNHKLIAWKNIVTEVHDNDIFSRPGKMEDLITRNCDVSYDEYEYDWDHPMVEEVMYWFKTVFVGEELVDYFLKICSSFLYGRNSEKKVYAFCGPSGDNSKSMIAKLLQKTLFVYVVNFPVHILTDDKQNSGGPTPELAQSKGSRIAFIAEPDGHIPFMGSLIKRYSGGDDISARKLFENDDNFEASFKIVLFCNEVPPIEGADESVENRLVILPFLSKYTDDCPKNVEDQFKQRKFPKDPLFENKISKYRRPMAWIMVNYFKKYRKEGLQIPDQVKSYTEKYWEDNNPYRLFISENMIRHTNRKNAPDDGYKINATKVYSVFKTWYRGNFNTKKYGIPDISNMVKHLSSTKNMGAPDGRIWTGWSIRSNEENTKDKFPPHRL